MANNSLILDKGIEELRETGRAVNKQVFSGWDQALAQQWFGNPKTPEEVKQLNLRERMMKEPLYKRRLEELNALKKNKPQDADTIQKKEQKINSDFQEQDRSLKAEVNAPSVNEKSKEQEHDEKREAEDREKEVKKVNKQNQLNDHVEAPAGKVTGFGGRRKSSPARLRPPKSSETKAGQGIGG